MTTIRTDIEPIKSILERVETLERQMALLGQPVPTGNTLTTTGNPQRSDAWKWQHGLDPETIAWSTQPADAEGEDAEKDSFAVGKRVARIGTVITDQRSPSASPSDRTICVDFAPGMTWYRPDELTPLDDFVPRREVVVTAGEMVNDVSEILLGHSAWTSGSSYARDAARDILRFVESRLNGRNAR